MNLINQNVLITGASSGIGYELAKEFHKKGSNLILVARRTDVLKDLSDKLNKERAESVQYFSCDLTQSKSPEFLNLVSYINQNRVDILVNNAGFGSFGYFEEQDIESELMQVRLNIEASTRFLHAVIPQMKQRKTGAIISVASIAGMQSLPFMATYSGTKAFNLFQAISLWYELKSFNVHVMALCPGPVKTEFGDVAKVPGSPSGATRLTAEYVAINTIKDLEKKKMISIPSEKMKLISIAIKFLPKRLITSIIGNLLNKVINRNHL